ncbi:MAG: hypothetical protein U9Q03_06360 [Patescibacteria group bacterium]|nr:hypothetical protein [Patescibacteria group bacterium]
MPRKRNPLPFYRQVLGDAWKLSITHKHLWMFGFFATFVGFGGVSEIMFGIYDRMTQLLPHVVGLRQTPMMLLPGFATMRAMMAMSPYPWLSMLIFTVVILLFFAVFASVVSIAVGALVGSVRKIERGGEPTLAEGVKLGVPPICKVFAINALAKITVLMLFLLTSANLVHLLSDRSLVSGFFYLTSYVVFTIVAVIVAIISVYATIAAVVDKLPIIPSVVNGWHLLKRHWLVNLEMVIVLLFVNVGLSVVALLIAMILSVPLIFLFVFAALLKSTALLTIIMTITAIVLISLIVLIGSFVTTFQAAAWTLLWLRLAKHRPTPKIVRFANWLQAKLKG